MRLQSTYYALECVPARVSAKALPLVVPSGVGEARPPLRSLQRQAPTVCWRVRGPSFWVCEKGVRACLPWGPESARPRSGHARCSPQPRRATFSSHSGARWCPARARGARRETARSTQAGRGGSPPRLLRVLVFAVRLQGRVHLLPQRLHLGRVREPLGVCEEAGAAGQSPSPKLPGTRALGSTEGGGGWRRGPVTGLPTGDTTWTGRLPPSALEAVDTTSWDPHTGQRRGWPRPAPW